MWYSTVVWIILIYNFVNLNSSHMAQIERFLFGKDKSLRLCIREVVLVTNVHCTHLLFGLTEVMVEG